MEKLHITRVIILEGRYDKIKVSSITDAMIIVTDGFGIFKDTQKRDLIKRLAAGCGLIVISDSDSAGNLIRNHLRSFVPAEQMVNLYVPCIAGKEKRKNAPSKEGLLGVEGIKAETLYKMLEPYAQSSAQSNVQSNERVERSHLFRDGFAGGQDSSVRRKKLLQALELPQNLSTSALLEALNLLGGMPLYLSAIEKLD